MHVNSYRALQSYEDFEAHKESLGLKLNINKPAKALQETQGFNYLKGLDQRYNLGVEDVDQTDYNTDPGPKKIFKNPYLNSLANISNFKRNDSFRGKKSSLPDINEFSPRGRPHYEPHFN